jgi:CBS domain-containing protein
MLSVEAPFDGRCTMSGSLMNADPTSPARRGPVDTVEVTPATPARVAAEVLAAHRLTAVVVVAEGRPLGVVTLDALTRAAAVARVADLMDYEVVRLDPGAGEIETLHAFRDAAWRSLGRRHPCAIGR